MGDLLTIIGLNTVKAVVSADMCVTALQKLPKKTSGTFGYIVNTDAYPETGSHWVLVVCELGKKQTTIKIFDPLHDVSNTSELVSRLKSKGGQFYVRRARALNWQADAWKCGYYCFYAFGAASQSGPLHLKTSFKKMPDAFVNIVEILLKYRLVPQEWHGKLFSESPSDFSRF